MNGSDLPSITIEEEGTRRPLDKLEMSVGRSPENDIRLKHPRVSRFHAQFTRQGPIVLLSDLGSANGTFVNGTRIRGTIQLNDGDRITFAESPVVLHVAQMAPASQVEPSPLASMTGRGGMSHMPEAALEGPDGEPILLVKSETVVGRVAGNDLVLDDSYVSRQHAKIQNVGGQFVLVDLGSSNGTWVNRRQLTQPYMLQPGDEIRFGTIPFVFRQIAAGAAQSAAKGAVAAFPVPQASPQVGQVSIAVDNVMKNYQSGDGAVPVLRGVSLQIREGEFVSLVGPSGSGKSTLINMMTGIDLPDSGTITVLGQRLDQLNENKMARWRGNSIGLIFQFFQLLPTLTAMENVMLPMDFCGRYASGKRRERAMECLALVGMDRFANRLPSAMSGGQQQRVAIARALANDPPIIIGDEPTGNLDSATAQQIFQLLGQFAQQGKTVAFVTHDPLLASSTPRKIEILDGLVVDASAAGHPVEAGVMAHR